MNVRLRADTVIPVSAPPIDDGAVLIDDRGRIAAVGPHTSVPNPSDVKHLEYPDALLIPGLVNVHTHLELTDVGGPIAAENFHEWIRIIRREVAARTPDTMAESAKRGVAEAWRCGTTTVADTGSSGAVAPALAEMLGRGIVYQEVFGPDPDQLSSSMTELKAKYEHLTAYQSERVKIGVSPHAPYTVSGDLYRAVAEFALQQNIPTAAHIAESPEESALIVENSGRFADAWVRRNIAPPVRAKSPIQFIGRHGLLETDLLAIHCVRVDRSDCAMLASHDCAVATCPTSNKMHGHGDAPLLAIVDAGIRVGAGTDSVASVGTLDLFREGRHIQGTLGLSDLDTLRFLTLEAAAALRMEHEVGSLEAGKWGDVVAIEAKRSAKTPALQVMASTPANVLATFVAGRRVYHRDESDSQTRGTE